MNLEDLLKKKIKYAYRKSWKIFKYLCVDDIDPYKISSEDLWANDWEEYKITPNTIKVTVKLETSVEIPFHVPDFCNSDTIEDYKEELMCEIGNAALDCIWANKMKDISEDCSIISAEPYEEGIDTFNELIKKYQSYHE